jgi:hypothetical protein
VEPDAGWLETQEGQAWLDSTDGHDWLKTPAGNDWFLGTDGGLFWGRTQAGERYLESIFQEGFETFFSGDFDEADVSRQGWFTPGTAPAIGARMRLTEDVTTMDGTSIRKGELVIVSQLTLAPVGSVDVHVRTVDGRKWLAMSASSLDPA